MIDTLIIGFDIEDYEERNKNLFEALEIKKKKAAEIDEKMINDKVNIVIEYFEFNVLGNGKQGFSYILHNDLLEVDIARYRSKKDEFYPIRVRFKQEYLWSCGIRNCWIVVEEWINKSFGEVIDVKIGRVDMACHTDLINLDIKDLERFKGKYRKQSIFLDDRKLNTINFGSRESGIYLRIYNKSLEIKTDKKKEWFKELWEVYNADKNKDIWNVEFELKREYLRDIGINNFSDLYERINSVWRYLTEKWIVYVKKDNKRIERCSIRNEWLEIQKAFDNYEDKPIIKREKQLNYEASAMIPQIIGCVVSYGARLGVDDIEYVFDVLYGEGEKYLKKKKTTYDLFILEKMKELNHKVVDVV